MTSELNMQLVCHKSFFGNHITLSFENPPINVFNSLTTGIRNLLSRDEDNINFCPSTTSCGKDNFFDLSRNKRVNGFMLKVLFLKGEYSNSQKIPILSQGEFNQWKLALEGFSHDNRDILMKDLYRTRLINAHTYQEITNQVPSMLISAIVSIDLSRELTSLPPCLRREVEDSKIIRVFNRHSDEASSVALRS